MSAAGVGQIQFEGVMPISHPRSRLSTPAGLRFLAMAGFSVRNRAIACCSAGAFLSSCTLRPYCEEKPCSADWTPAAEEFGDESAAIRASARII